MGRLLPYLLVLFMSLGLAAGILAANGGWSSLIAGLALIPAAFLALEAARRLAKEDSRELDRVRNLQRDMEERNRIETALREREFYLETIFRASPVGIAVLKRRVFMDVNNQLLRITGYEAGDLLDRSTRMLYPDENEFHRVGQEFYEQIRENGIGSLESRWIRKDGGVIHVLLGAVYLTPDSTDDHITLSVLDISSRVRAESHRRRYEAIMSTVSDLMAFVDTGYTYRAVSHVYTTLFNTPRERILGRTVPDFLGKEVFGEKIQPHMDACLEGREKHYTEWFNFPNGSRLYMSMHLHPYRETDGTISGIVVNGRDITEMENARLEKLELERRLRHSQKMEAIGTLAGGIAHDFNNILFPIIGYAELLLAEADHDPAIREKLDGILAAAERARQLIRQILTASRQGRSERSLIRLQPIVTEVLTMLRSTLPTTIDIVSDLSPDPGPVMADPTEAHQIVMNLCTNAFHAMEATGGTLTVRLEEIRETAPETPLIRLVVGDTGGGIPPDIQERVFEPFFTTKPASKGTGLGLSVVHGIVTGYGGTIRIDSAPGRGTEVFVHLPGAAAAPEFPPSQTRDAPVSGGAGHLLVVDDEENIRSLLRAGLENQGYRVSTAPDGEAALELFRRDPNVFDLVITDLTMPRKTGDVLAMDLHRIRPRLPIILLSGYASGFGAERLTDAGIRRVLTKPLHLSELFRNIQDLLDPDDGLGAWVGGGPEPPPDRPS